jgi:hypothetical protein
MAATCDPHDLHNSCTTTHNTATYDQVRPGRKINQNSTRREKEHSYGKIVMGQVGALCFLPYLHDENEEAGGQQLAPAEGERGEEEQRQQQEEEQWRGAGVTE